MLDAKKYELSGQEWNLENINKMVKQLEDDIREESLVLNLESSLIAQAKYNNILMEAYHILQDLWLNRNKDSRFPEWFEDLYVPEVFKDIFHDVFGDFELNRE